MAGEYLKSSVHVHSKLCDGKNTLDEIAVTAWRNGLQTLGFSGHSHTPCDLEYCMTQSRTALYKAQIAKLKERYAGKMDILCGLEWDLYSDVKLAAQKLCGLTRQLDQYIDAHRHVGAAEDRRFGAGGLQHGLVRLGKTGGTDHAGQTVGCAILCCSHSPGGRGKVDDNAAAGQRIKVGEDGDLAQMPRLAVHTGVLKTTKNAADTRLPRSL